MSALWWVLISCGAPAQEEPPRPGPLRLRTEVHVFIEERPEEEFSHDYYEQPYATRHRTQLLNPGSLLTSSIEFRSACRPQEEDRDTAMPPPPPPSSTLPPLVLSAAFGRPRMSVSLPNRNEIVSGRRRQDPILTTASLGSGGASGGSDSLTSSDAPFLYGPELDLVLARDLSSWRGTSWMPGDSSLHVYGRVLFGSFEVFDTPIPMELYGVGPRLSVPVWRRGGFTLDAQLSAGPAFLKTDLGDALGFDAGLGFRAEQVLSRSLSCFLAVEANAFLSENVTAFGPLLNLGVNLSW